jgi:signal transduction histidine kinase
MTIRVRLALWYTCLFAITVFVMGVFLYLFMVRSITNEVDRRLLQTGKEVIQSIQIIPPFTLDRGFIVPVLPDIDVFTSPDTFLQVVNPSGRILARSSNLGKQQLPISKELLNGVKSGHEGWMTLRVGEQRVRIYVMPIIINGQVYGMLQVGSVLITLEKAIQHLRLLLFIAATIGAVAAGLLGWFLAGRALMPIKQVVKQIDRVQKGEDLRKRVDYNGPPDEMADLTHRINEMLARLEKVYSDLTKAYEEMEKSYAAQRRFVSDASHELRTPLTSIRGNIEYLQKINADSSSKEVILDVMDEIERMIRLVNDLLMLARADAKLVIKKESVALYQLIQNAKRAAERLPHYTSLVVEFPEGLKNVVLYGNPDFLKQVAVILLDNAFKYAPQSVVTLRAMYESGRAGFCVEDQGEGMDEETMSHLFERFYRADKARTGMGTGLGLSIAKWIVEEHGGTITVSSRPGEGSRFTVWLPARISSSAHHMESDDDKTD